MNFWKQKLADYLHDPPSKVLDIKNHVERSQAAYRQAGFIDTEIGDYLNEADHTAAAADRLPFPSSKASGLLCAFDGVRNAFRHPLNGEPLPFASEFITVEQGFEAESVTQPVLSEASLQVLPDDEARDRARFFAHWRLWPKHATEKDYRFSFLPADTRIPDHSVWNHMQVVSALGSCVDTGGQLKPAFLKFQLGPVQDFIAAARSTRDLWSGSYLLSWLMAAGLKALSAEVGPDAVIFPNLRDQPLFDLQWRDELWSKVGIDGQRSVWENFKWDSDDLLVPNLPNVFLAVVPASHGTDLARIVERAVRDEWSRIADSVWAYCQDAGLTSDEGGDSDEAGALTEKQRLERFQLQVRRFLSLSWQVTPWPETIEQAVSLAGNFAGKTPVKVAAERVKRVADMAEKDTPKEHRDVRNYECPRVPVGQPKAGWKDKSRLAADAKLDNVGLAWSVILAVNGWQLDAVRQTRAFEVAHAGGWEVGTFYNKDALTGKDEAVAGGREWKRRAESAGEPISNRFKTDHWLGATTLVKRLWDLAYLKPKWKLEVPKFPHTRGIAAGDPFGQLGNDDDKSLDVEQLPPSEKYFAVLAFDGDEIGKWVSGEKTPQFSSQLVECEDFNNSQKFGSKPYFNGSVFRDFLDAQRLLSPSYHLQFSESLSNFARICADPVVRAFKGRLIYAGGDDVVALLPADMAIACGEALRMAFRGLEVRGPYGKVLFKSPKPGFLTHANRCDYLNRPIPFLVPGPRADASVGIAMAHFKAPLQDVVRAAHAAEKRAKKKHGRAAVAATLMKRSGEIVEWGAKWEGGLQLHNALMDALQKKHLSAKFPHRLAELLEPYLSGVTPFIKAQVCADVGPSGATTFPVSEVIQREFHHCLSRQRGAEFPGEQNEAFRLESELQKALTTYLEVVVNSTSKNQSNTGANSESDFFLNSVLGLCQTVAFAHRTADEAQPDDSSPKGKS